MTKRGQSRGKFDGPAIVKNTFDMAQLSAYVNAILNCLSEEDAISRKKSTIYKEAHAAGFDTKALRACVVARRVPKGMLSDERVTTERARLYADALDSMSFQHPDVLRPALRPTRPLANPDEKVSVVLIADQLRGDAVAPPSPSSALPSKDSGDDWLK